MNLALPREPLYCREDSICIEILFCPEESDAMPPVYTADLPDTFFATLRAVNERLAPDNPYFADWLLTLMQSESGIKPSVGNAGGAAYYGINQLGKSVFAPLTPAEFTALSAAEQLPYVEKFYKGAPISKMLTAGNLYQYNFLPGSLARGLGGDTVIAGKGGTGYGGHEGDYYAQNAGLDTDKSGAITVADLDARLAGIAKSERVKEAVNRLPPPSRGYPTAGQVQANISGVSPTWLGVGIVAGAGLAWLGYRKVTQ